MAIRLPRKGRAYRLPTGKARCRPLRHQAAGPVGPPTRDVPWRSYSTPEGISRAAPSRRGHPQRVSCYVRYQREGWLPAVATHRGRRLHTSFVRSYHRTGRLHIAAYLVPAETGGHRPQRQGQRTRRHSEWGGAGVPQTPPATPNREAEPRHLRTTARSRHHRPRPKLTSHGCPPRGPTASRPRRQPHAPPSPYGEPMHAHRTSERNSATAEPKGSP